VKLDLVILAAAGVAALFWHWVIVFVVLMAVVVIVGRLNARR
jgi:hypothetical protein